MNIENKKKYFILSVTYLICSILAIIPAPLILILSDRTDKHSIVVTWSIWDSLIFNHSYLISFISIVFAVISLIIVRINLPNKKILSIILQGISISSLIFLFIILLGFFAIRSA